MRTKAVVRTWFVKIEPKYPGLGLELEGGFPSFAELFEGTASQRDKKKRERARTFPSLCSITYPHIYIYMLHSSIGQPHASYFLPITIGTFRTDIYPIYVRYVIISFALVIY